MNERELFERTPHEGSAYARMLADCITSWRPQLGADDRAFVAGMRATESATYEDVLRLRALYDAVVPEAR